MKIFAILGLTLLIFVIGAFAFVGLSDAPVSQTTITRDIETAPTAASAPSVPTAAPTVTAPVATAPVANETAPAAAPVSPETSAVPPQTPAATTSVPTE